MERTKPEMFVELNQIVVTVQFLLIYWNSFICDVFKSVKLVIISNVHISVFLDALSKTFKKKKSRFWMKHERVCVMCCDQ